MKKKEKRMILILVVITIIVAIIFFATRGDKKENENNGAQVEENKVVEEFVQVLEDGTKLNTSTKLNETKNVDGYKFENIQFTEQNGQSVLLADVTNTSGSAKDITLVDVILLDKQGNEIVKVGGIISPLQPGASTQFNTSMTLDYANSYDVKIVVK